VALALGLKLGPYELAASIGAGGMGEVYRAHDARLGRDVAVKIISGGWPILSKRVRRNDNSGAPSFSASFAERVGPEL